ncbi:MAG: alpha/beta hydrolase-fold protein [Planctomycetota bacterium]|nr:alpha/beta hydrolase-fold protein [Planctomycetota bacterium]
MSDEIQSQIVSPEVRGNSVTFRLKAPRAREVFVVGIEGQPKTPMVASSQGIWAVELNGLPPELYSYAFEVDGTRMIDPSNREVKKWLSCNSLFEIKGGLLHEQKNCAHGELRELIYDSQTTRTQRSVLVYTPPGYRDLQDLPVLFLLHGYGDDHLAWKEVGRAHFIVDNLIAEKRIRPCVVVMPYGHPVPLDLKKQFDDYASSNLESMNQDLVEDLLPLVLKQFRVSRERSHHAIVGLSMGGGQSISIGLKNASHFSRIGGFSAAAPQGEFARIDDAFKRVVNDVETFNRQNDLLWLACGSEDFLFERNNHFASWLKSREIKHTYQVSKGGHDWRVWRKYLGQFLGLAFPSQ